MADENGTSGAEKIPVLKLGKHAPRYPLIQGGMGIKISASSLASAVARAGGVGTIAAVALGLSSKYYNGKNYFKANKAALADEIKLARDKAPDGVLAINAMVAITDYDSMVRIAAENGIDVVISGAGLPLNLPELTSGYPDVALVPIVSSAKAAKVIVHRWERYGRLPDGFVVEAPGAAGGHLGAKAADIESPKLTLEVVVPELVRYIAEELKEDIPVIAAGGVWYRQDMLDAFSLGARGVQMGTRFVCTEECDAHPAFKEEFLKATKDDIVIMASPVGLPGRAIKNEFLRKLDDGSLEGQRCLANCLRSCTLKSEKKGFCIATALSEAQQGNIDDGLVFCGSNAYLCDKIVTVNEVMEDLFGPPA